MGIGKNTTCETTSASIDSPTTSKAKQRRAAEERLKRLLETYTAIMALTKANHRPKKLRKEQEWRKPLERKRLVLW